MFLAILYIFFCGFILYLARFIHKFLISFYKKPFLVNSYAEFIPSEAIIQEKYIKNKNGTYSSVISIQGYSYHKEKDLEKAIENNYKLRCNSLNFNNLKENIHIKFTFKRYKVSPDSFENNYYIELTGELDTLKEVLGSLSSSLDCFSPIILTNEKLIQYLFFNCNLVKKEQKLPESIAIHDLCSYSTIRFDKDYGILNNIDTKKYFKVFTFNFGSEIDNAFFTKLITSHIEFDFILNTKFFTKLNMLTILSKDKKSINSSKSKEGELNITLKKANEIAQATETLMNEEANLAMSDTFIIVYADTDKEIENIGYSIKEIVNNYEINLVEETYLLNFFFLQKLCGFSLHNTLKFLIPTGDILVYAKKILSSTLAGMFDYIDTPKGITSCDWGNGVVAKFNTHYNNLYNFNLHIDEQSASVAHGVVVAPTGGGKTTLMQYIMNGILDNFKDVDIYVFDRFAGVEIFTEYKHGKNIDFENIALNPLLLDLSKEENKIFLNTFIAMLAKGKTTQDMELIHKLVNAVSLLPTEKRILKDIVEKYIPNSELKDNLNQWLVGRYNQYISGHEDNIDLTSGNFFTFQMDKILDDEELSAPIIFLMMFKIRQKARNTGRGHFIFIDESAKMVKNSYFKEQIEVLLQEHRKLRGGVWLAFQNPNSFLQEELLRELILGQCQNQILFTSHSINETTLERLGIHNSFYQELELAKKTQKNPYFVLLKRPHESVILNVNLKNILGDELKFYSSKTSDVNHMKELKNTHGEDWRGRF